MPLANGLITGLFLQLAVGPVFFYILSIAIESSFINSLFGALAVTVVDYFYIVLSILGIGKLFEKENIKKIFGIVSSIVLLIFGIIMTKAAFKPARELSTAMEWTYYKAFINCFVLTVSSPLTIVFWSSIFAAKAVEKSYTKKQLIQFGIGAGLATLLFLSISMFIISKIKHSIPKEVTMYLNIIVGIVIIAYGIIRLIKTIKMHLTIAST